VKTHTQTLTRVYIYMNFAELLAMLQRTRPLNIVLENVTENSVFTFGYSSRFVLATNVRVWRTFRHIVWCLWKRTCSVKCFS